MQLDITIDSKRTRRKITELEHTRRVFLLGGYFIRQSLSESTS